MEKLLDIEFEKAVRLLVKYFPVSEVGSRKPILFQDGVFEELRGWIKKQE